MVNYTEDYLKIFQKLNNQVYRTHSGTAKVGYTAACALRSEIIVSSSKARDIKNKILFCKTYSGNWKQ